MKYSYKVRKHSKGWNYTYISLNLNKIFKRKYPTKKDSFGRIHDYACYLVIKENNEKIVWLPGTLFPIKGQLIYIGRGVAFENYLETSRPNSHKDDELFKHLNEDTTIYIFGCGMTYEESSVLEEFWIRVSNLPLRKRNKPWDGKSLINVKTEKKWRSLEEKILKIYGDNTRFIIKGETNDN